MANFMDEPCHVCGCPTREKNGSGKPVCERCSSLRGKKSCNWEKFCDKFQKIGGDWKLQGCEFIREAEKFAKGRKDVDVLACNDYSASGSRIVVFHHKNMHRYWGCCCVYIPQYGAATAFHMCPDEIRALVRSFCLGGQK